MTEGKFIPIDILCKHCHQPLEARRRMDSDLEVEGFYDLEFRHQGGEYRCEVPSYAHPSSLWDATAIYKKAVKDD